MGVDEKVSAKALKKAYREKAKEFHPDINTSPEAETQFKKVLEAYMILSDHEKRAVYDRGFEIPTVEVPNRPNYPPPHAFDKRYGRANISGTKLDLSKYVGVVKITGVITFLFAFTFLLDFLFYTEYNSLRVTQVQSKSIVTKKIDDVGIAIVRAGPIVFEKRRNIEDELSPNDIIDIRKSLIYGHFKFKRELEVRFQSATILANIIQVAALLIYITSLTAIFAKKNIEVRFNAGLIAAFFSLALLIFVLLT